jgi:hypothetical protein
VDIHLDQGLIIMLPNIFDFQLEINNVCISEQSLAGLLEG